MAQVVQLLREVSQSDPRLSMITSEALRVLIEGGQSRIPPPPPMAGPGGPGPMGAMPVGRNPATPIGGPLGV